jgi:caffeoyl-CoA O-methyltransferase
MTYIAPAWQHHGLITHPEVDDYLYSLLPARDEVLAEMEASAGKRNIPIVGPLVASILYQYAQLIDAKAIFEMGSAIGYSTIWWARAVGKDGRVFYTDGNRKNSDEARGYFQRAGVSDQIDVQTGDALELISEQKQDFDIVFCDIDKKDYSRALKLALPRIRKGGLFIADNVLWSGRVTEKNPDALTRSIQEFTRTLYASQELMVTILPARDGLAIAMKK